jgi:hypothetical protein
VFLCEEIFKRLVVSYPSKELRLIDMTLKMYTQPVLSLDSAMLVDALHEEKEKRETLLHRLGVDEAVLASNPKFAAALEALGAAFADLGLKSFIAGRQFELHIEVAAIDAARFPRPSDIASLPFGTAKARHT